jgi:rhamnosyltransferase
MTPPFALVVPMLNAAPWLPDLLAGIAAQSVQPARFVVVDSSSDDDTAEQCRRAGAEVIVIRRQDFDHGRTRQMAIDGLSGVDYVVLMTQDAIPADKDAFANLLRSFEDPKTGVAYGRQLPRIGAGAIEAHARLFNYPDADRLDDSDTMRTRGVRASFCSNSFAAYRLSALSAVGGFPRNCILGEDTVASTSMMQNGWRKRYVADAKVLHSHDYRIAQEFRRYFDIGVMHVYDAELRSAYRFASGEGMKFVLSELRYLLGHAPLEIPSALIRTALKLCGYRAGKAYRKLPQSWITHMSMHRGWWARQDDLSLHTA